MNAPRARDVGTAAVYFTDRPPLGPLGQMGRKRTPY